jgi:cyclopropane-fatty-acyl-phospholipid synthase
MGLPAELASEITLVEDATTFLEHLFAQYPKRDFQIRLWDGSTWGVKEMPRFRLVLKHPGALRKMFREPSELSLGEAYIFDDFDIEGEVEAAMELSDALVKSDFDLAQRLHLAALLRKLPKGDRQWASRQSIHLVGAPHSRRRDRQVIAYHYNLPADFYSLFLGQRLVYSCAYFQTADDGLDKAQEQKLDYICRKLRLRSGDRLLDVGCGWGALVLHAANYYGVHALGITLSAPQAEVARERIEQAGLSDRCQIEVCDYRELAGEQRFDKIVSVGMFEHVGEKMLPEYFAKAWQLLEPGGVFLNHGIAYSATYQRKGESFVDRYVFPDGELVPLNIALRTAEMSRFEVRDVESLREHYALTLRRWLSRLEEHQQQAKKVVDDVTYRIWRLYMAGSAYGFRTARLNLYQTLLAKPGRGESRLPLTRADWYRD